jgi:hypothetical protein
MPKPLNQLSADGLKYWSRCKKQFYYKHVLKLRWPANIQHFSLGRDVHKLLDYQSRGLDCTPLLKNATEAVNRSWQKLLHHPIVQLPILANEWAFHVPVCLPGGEQEWLTGRIDRVAQEAGKVLVIDWKTGTGIPRNPSTDWQTRLYLFAVKEVASATAMGEPGFSHPQKPLQAKDMQFVYVEVKADTHTPIREIRLDYTEAQHEETRDTLIGIFKQMKQPEGYPLPENRVCPDRFCVYHPICGIHAGGVTHA